MDEKYKEICDKLGCIPSEVEIPDFEDEDDAWVNPFSVLTEEESDYLYNNGYLNKQQN